MSARIAINAPAQLFAHSALLDMQHRLVPIVRQDIQAMAVLFVMWDTTETA